MNPVRLVHADAVLECHSQDPFNPHPVFPQWSPHPVYPYPFWGSMTRNAVQRRYAMPALENDYLRVTVAADIGGRIWDIYDKIGKRHLANYNTGVRSYNAGFGLNYTTGGLEINYPYAHSCTTNAPREISFERGADGSAAIVVSEYERIWRTRWSVAIRLRSGCAAVEQEVRLYNRTPMDSRYMYWANCGFVLKPNTRFLFPETEGAMHGQERNTFSWPLWRGHDMSRFRSIPPQALGLYFLHAQEPFFGYYDEDEAFGLVHYGDLADLPGKKYWTWGTSPATLRQYRKTHHTLGEVYGEIQSGRIVIQEHLDRMPPESECRWTERWFPVRDIGPFQGAGPGAAIAADVLESDTKRSRLRVRAMANERFPRARLQVASDGLPPIEQPFPVSPDQAAERVVTMPGPIGPASHTAVAIVDPVAGRLAVCRLRAPNSRDSWREPPVYVKTCEPVGAETLFFAAERVARDWGNHDLEPPYRKALEADSGFSPAHLELGKLALFRGRPEEAIRHLEAAGARDEDGLAWRYFYGLALTGAGRLAEARHAFERTARYDGEARGRTRLAELAMRDRDWHQALGHLDRVESLQPRVTRPRGLRAACLRRLGRLAEASAAIEAARTVDRTDPFLQYEAMFIAAGSVEPGRLSAKPLAALIEQVRGQEEPLLEAAFDYLAAGLETEAAAVVESLPQPGALALFLLAWIRDRLGRTRASRTALAAACRRDPVYQHPWRLEMIAVLEWAAAQRPASPRPVWLLGNLLMARRRTEEAVALWRRAERMGETHALLAAGLGHYERHVAKRLDRALAWFRKAAQRDSGDLYIKKALFDALCALNRSRAAAAYLEREAAAVRKSPQLAFDLMSLYLEWNDFRRFDAWALQCRFPVNWNIPGPHRLWAWRQVKEGLVLIGAGRLQEALAILTDPKPMPAHLGLEMAGDYSDERRYYHIGCIYDRMGKPDEARRWWEKAPAIPHFCGYEPSGCFQSWNRRYYHALCLQKLGRTAEAETYFDAMTAQAESPEMPLAARRRLLQLAERGRTAPESEKDPVVQASITVATRAEL